MTLGDDIVLQNEKFEQEYRYRLEHDGVDEILNAMFRTDEANEQVKQNPITNMLYQQLRQTIRKNIQLEKEILRLKRK